MVDAAHAQILCLRLTLRPSQGIRVVIGLLRVFKRLAIVELEGALVMS